MIELNKVIGNWFFFDKNEFSLKRKPWRTRMEKVSSTNFNPFPGSRFESHPSEREIKCFFRELSDERLFLMPRKVKMGGQWLGEKIWLDLSVWLWQGRLEKGIVKVHQSDIHCGGGGLHSTEEEYLPHTQQPQVQITTFPNFYRRVFSWIIDLMFLC